jgi:hypothetical protein
MSEKEVKKDPKKQALLAPLEPILQSIGYQSGEVPIKKSTLTKPEYYGTRENSVLAIYVVADLKTLAADVPRLKLVRFQMGKGIDYVLLIPPCDIKQVVDIVLAEDEKNYKMIMREGFSVWMWDAATSKIMSYFNMPADKVLKEKIENKGDVVAKK